MDDAALAQGPGKHLLDGGDQARCAVGDDEERVAETSVHQVLQEPPPGLGRLRGCGHQPHEVAFPVGVDPPGAQDRLGRGVLVELEVGAVQEQVIETVARQVTPSEGVELVFDLLADPRHRRLGQRRFVAEHLFQGGFDVTVRQPAHPGRDDQGLEGVGAGHPHLEQL